MSKQRYLEVKKTYPAGRIGGPDGAGKSWFQCRVCSGRGTSRNYDIERTDEKQTTSCGCKKDALSAAYELNEIEGMTTGAKRNIVTIFHETRSAVVTAKQTGRRKITVDILIRITYERLAKRFILWKMKLIAAAARFNRDEAMKIYKLTAAELHMVGNIVQKAIKAARAVAQSAWDKLTRVQQEQAREISMESYYVAQGICQGDRKSAITTQYLLTPKEVKAYSWVGDAVKDVLEVVSDVVMLGFAKKAASSIKRSRANNLVNLRYAMNNAAKGIKRRRQKKAVVVDASGYVPYVPAISRPEIAAAMTVFAQAV